jgi:hypothetical protein
MQRRDIRNLLMTPLDLAYLWTWAHRLDLSRDLRELMP